MVFAHYGTKRGGSGFRTVHSSVEAEKILKGGYGVTNVKLFSNDGELVGERWKSIEDGKWTWSYDQSYF